MAAGEESQLAPPPLLGRSRNSPPLHCWGGVTTRPPPLQVLFNCFRRVLGDLSTVFHHYPVVHHLLSSPELFRDSFLDIVAMLQLVVPHRRNQGGECLAWALWQHWWCRTGATREVSVQPGRRRGSGCASQTQSER